MDRLSPELKQKFVDVASYLLCRRFHQSQSSKVADLWLSKIIPNDPLTTQSDIGVESVSTRSTTDSVALARSSVTRATQTVDSSSLTARQDSGIGLPPFDRLTRSQATAANTPGVSLTNTATSASQRAQVHHTTAMNFRFGHKVLFIIFYVLTMWQKFQKKCLRRQVHLLRLLNPSCY